MRYTFVTVAHRIDWGMLRLQARSLARYLPPDLAAQIIVVHHPIDGAPPWRPPDIRPEYGGLAPLVRVMEAAEVAAIPRDTRGWWAQQILKLMIARVVTTERYVVLDAKNHMIFPLTREFLEADGRIVSHRMNYTAHPMRSVLERTLRYFGLDPNPLLEEFLPTTTPFTLRTHDVRRAMSYVSLRERAPFPVAMARRQLSEFFLVAAFLRAHGGPVEEVYDLSGPVCPTIWDWIAGQGVHGIAPLIARAEQHALPFFAIHRRAVPILTDAARLAIGELWCRRQLFRSEAEACAFLLDPDAHS